MDETDSRDAERDQSVLQMIIVSADMTRYEIERRRQRGLDLCAEYIRSWARKAVRSLARLGGSSARTVFANRRLDGTANSAQGASRR
jgi:hypothetical protein